jgi:selenocysteine lyase/cysteine desulfurase
MHVERVGVVSINVDGFEPQVLSGILDDSFRIETRAGLHCAPRIHRRIGSFDRGGTVRFSVGPFTTPAEIDAAVTAVREIASSG